MKLNTRSDQKNNPIVILLGPTGVGKTDLILKYFQRGFEIISADSMQVYRGMDIGTAKPSKEESRRIPHHLIDIRDPWESFSVGDFIELADRAIEEIRQRGKIPLISGGTAFYLRHLLYGLSEVPPSDPQLREELSERYAGVGGLTEAYRRLCAVDPAHAARTDANNRHRILRALEVHEQTGRPLSTFIVPTKYREGLHPVCLGLQREPEELHGRIRARVEMMMAQGLHDEIKRLIAAGASSNWPGMKGIGYKEFLEARESGEYSLHTIAEAIITHTRAYVKRQRTFFAALPDVTWFHPDDTHALCDHLSAHGISL